MDPYILPADGVDYPQDAGLRPISGTGSVSAANRKVVEGIASFRDKRIRQGMEESSEIILALDSLTDLMEIRCSTLGDFAQACRSNYSLDRFLSPELSPRGSRIFYHHFFKAINFYETPQKSNIFMIECVTAIYGWNAENRQLVKKSLDDFRACPPRAPSKIAPSSKSLPRSETLAAASSEIQKSNDESGKNIATSNIHTDASNVRGISPEHVGASLTTSNSPVGVKVSEFSNGTSEPLSKSKSDALVPSSGDSLQQLKSNQLFC